MCLSIPSQVVQLHPEDNCVTVDNIGDYVLLHIGFVMSKIDEAEAQASLESFRQMVALMPKQETLPC